MTTTTVRHPAVAGRFYPGDREALRSDVRSYLSAGVSQKAVRALGCIVPHAGYMYSGHVAGAVFAQLEIPEICIVLCPNHTGIGQPLAIISVGSWETPLGDVHIASEFAVALKQHFPLLHEDTAAHRNEHAAEVELPFLQTRQPKLKFIPIALGTGHFEVLENLGEAIAEIIAEAKSEILIVASSDMNH